MKINLFLKVLKRSSNNTFHSINSIPVSLKPSRRVSWDVDGVKSEDRVVWVVRKARAKDFIKK